MRRLFIASLLLGGATVSQAQAPYVSKPIDANKLIVQPGDQISGVTAGATTGTFRTITRSIAGAVENNGFVKTINNLLGRRAAPPPTMQGGFSPLPAPNTYRSTAYPSNVAPMVPTTQQFGRTPAIIMPVAPSANK